MLLTRRARCASRFPLRTTRPLSHRKPNACRLRFAASVSPFPLAAALAFRRNHDKRRRRHAILPGPSDFLLIGVAAAVAPASLSVLATAGAILARVRIAPSLLLTVRGQRHAGSAYRHRHACQPTDESLLPRQVAPFSVQTPTRLAGPTGSPRAMESTRHYSRVRGACEATGLFLDGRACRVV